MRINVKCAVVWLVLAVLIAPACHGQDAMRYRFRVSDGVLRQGGNVLIIRAIQAPELGQPAPTTETIAPGLARASAVGANTICFDLHGFSADGTAFPAEAVKALNDVLEQVTWRRMGTIVRVFPPDAPQDAKYRLAAAAAAGKALQRKMEVIFWIDGPDCAKLAAAFKKEAPEVIVAAPEGGDIRVVTVLPAEQPKEPVLLAGALPPQPDHWAHCVLAADDASYPAMDKFLANPVESQPWQPDNSVLTEAEQKDGWISLFDGKSLNGWWVVGPNKQGFEVRDGCIEWVRVGGVALYTHDRYANFILRLEWKIGDKGNSGVFLRAPRANPASKIGMEFQLMGDYGVPLTTETTGSVYDVVPPLKNAGKPAGEWNEVEITFIGPKLKVVLNGEVIQDLSFDDNEELKPRLREGFIGLQDHARAVSFRNIRVKKL